MSTNQHLPGTDKKVRKKAHLDKHPRVLKKLSLLCIMGNIVYQIIGSNSFLFKPFCYMLSILFFCNILFIYFLLNVPLPCFPFSLISLSKNNAYPSEHP